jgi:Tfp pilus assembly protein PilV
MMRHIKELIKVREDQGLSLAEVLVAVGLTGLLALGCTQLALASFSSAKYTQDVAVKSIDSGNANRMVTSDMENADGFLVPAKPGTAASPAECSTVNAPIQGVDSVRALLSMQYPDNTLVGYEVRTVAGVGAIWRVDCPSLGNPTGPSQMVRNNLPASTDPVWDSAVMCASFPAGGSLTSAQCTKDVLLTSITTNPGIIFTIPATVGSSTAISTGQIIVAARNVG